MSVTSAERAINLVKKPKEELSDNGYNRFHKVVSNNLEVMKAFSSDDLGKDLKDLDLYSDNLPTQRSLSLSWDLHTNNFLFMLEN